MGFRQSPPAPGCLCHVRIVAHFSSLLTSRLLSSSLVLFSLYYAIHIRLCHTQYVVSAVSAMSSLFLRPVPLFPNVPRLQNCGLKDPHNHPPCLSVCANLRTANRRRRHAGAIPTALRRAYDATRRRPRQHARVRICEHFGCPEMGGDTTARHDRARCGVVHRIARAST